MKSRSKFGYVRAFEHDSDKSINQRKIMIIMEGIWAEYERRLKPGDWLNQEGNNTRNESAKNFLRREIYALGWRLIRSEPQSWELEDLVNQMRDTKTTRPEALSNVFHALLMCVYRADTRITRQDRSLIAKELEYAHRHKIPPSLLCGFLYQSTDRRDIGERLKANFIEPAFRE